MKGLEIHFFKSGISLQPSSLKAEFTVVVFFLYIKRAADPNRMMIYGTSVVEILSLSEFEHGLGGASKWWAKASHALPSFDLLHVGLNFSNIGLGLSKASIGHTSLIWPEPLRG